MGGIDLDPCTSSVAQGWIKAKRFYTAEEDGLSKRWKGRVWLNAPYESSLVAQFVEAAFRAFRFKRQAQAVDARACKTC
jgi:hypothetical protein